ncbi:MAG: DNA repair protein RecO [Thermoleophilia bacterium]|nr:DNA repair protein RecO [Thermoleophilia bacterium]
MPRDYSTDAIVLGSHKLGDADRVVTLFTAARGKVPTVVKGVRKIKSRFGGRLEPFTQLQVQLHEGRNLHTLTGADTVKTHAVIRDDPAALRAALGFIEMLGRATPDFEKLPRSYNLLVNYLLEMDAAALSVRSARAETGKSGQSENELRGNTFGNAAGRDLSASESRFVIITLGAELKLLLLAGFLPHLADCAICGSSGSLPRFSAEIGGALCENCGGESFRVQAETLVAMRGLLETPLAEAGSSDIDERTAREVWRCVREICRYHLGTDLKIEPW